MRNQKPSLVAISAMLLCSASSNPASAGWSLKKLGKGINQVAINVGKTTEKTVHDTGTTLQKGAQDSGKATEKGVHDLGHGVEATTRFAGREVQAVGQTLSDADKRLREGKILDAAWHAIVDPARHTERNAARAAQESNVLRTVGQVAASAYGGPAGAAAFSTWYAYRITGDVKTALKSGAITGATSLAFAQIDAAPARTGSEIAGKALAAGVVAGAAVGISGGSEKDIRDGLLLGVGTSLAQTVYEKTVDRPIDGRSSNAPGYCKASPGAGCAPDVAYVRDGQGNIVYDGKDPRVDLTKLKYDPNGPRPSQVGKYDIKGERPFIGVGERSGFMTAVSRVPGMNAMGWFHDQWSTNWRMPLGINEITIAPATIMTYAGTGAPLMDRLQMANAKEKTKPLGE